MVLSTGVYWRYDSQLYAMCTSSIILEAFTFSSLIKSQANEIKKASLYTILGIIFSFTLLSILIVLLRILELKLAGAFTFKISILLSS